MYSEYTGDIAIVRVNGEFKTGKCQGSGILPGSRFLNCTLLVWSYSSVHGKNRKWAVGSIMNWIISKI